MVMKPCELCGRVTRDGTTAHHLIPRTCHSNKWFKKRYTRAEMAQTVDLCRDCHRGVHDLIPNEKELGRIGNTLEKLREIPAIARHLTWVRRQS